MIRRRYLVAYDIRDEARLRQVHVVCLGWGDPLQYSVFVCDLSRGEKSTMKGDLLGAMNAAVDSVVFVDLGEARGRGAECFEFLGMQPWDLPSGGSTVL
jgi:CRISPR-associated protein Cas2